MSDVAVSYAKVEFGKERKVFRAEGIIGPDVLKCGKCGICRTNSLLCSQNNKVGPGLAPEGRTVRLGRALNAELKSANLPTGYGL